MLPKFLNGWKSRLCRCGGIGFSIILCTGICRLNNNPPQSVAESISTFQFLRFYLVSVNGTIIENRRSRRFYLKKNLKALFAVRAFETPFRYSDLRLVVDYHARNLIRGHETRCMELESKYVVIWEIDFCCGVWLVGFDCTKRCAQIEGMRLFPQLTLTKF